MSNILSHVEREIIIKYLQENLPKMLLKAVDTTYIPAEQDFPTFEPLDIPEKSYSIVKDSIIFLPRLPTSRVIADKAPVCLFFYYNGRGMFFESQYRHVTNGFAIVIPEHIFKQSDEKLNVLQDVKCTIFTSDLAESYTGNKTQNKINCVTSREFPLFTKLMESQIPVEFFTLNIHPANSAVENRIQPPFLLYISETYLFLGSLNDKFSFTQGATYKVSLSIPGPILDRDINASIILEDFFQSDTTEPKFCYKFSFKDLKAEDQRFLSEKITCL